MESDVITYSSTIYCLASFNGWSGIRDESLAHFPIKLNCTPRTNIPPFDRFDWRHINQSVSRRIYSSGSRSFKPRAQSHLLCLTRTWWMDGHPTTICHWLDKNQMKKIFWGRSCSLALRIGRIHNVMYYRYIRVFPKRHEIHSTYPISPH